MRGERRRWLQTKLSRLFRRGHNEAALDAELQFHLDQLVAHYRDEGRSALDAQLAARRELGDIGSYREEIRDAWRPASLADMWRTLRFAVRSLARTPGFTILAIVTLAFGLGANTMMFSAFDSVLLKPLPYPEVDQLDRFDRMTAQSPTGRIAPADFLDVQRAADGYGDIAAYDVGDTSLSETGRPSEMAVVARTTANFFSVLGVKLQLGRDFRAGEDRPGQDRVVILSRRCWLNRFGGSEAIVGSTIRVDGQSHVIVGVLPESFNDWRHLGSIDLFRPLAFDRNATVDRQSTTLRVFGRRTRGVSVAQADGFIAAFGARLAADHPEVDAGSSWRAARLTDSVEGRDSRATMSMCVGLSAFVLLIACSNLANLLLARTMARAREFAVRSALGASRGQILRPLVTESLLLALAGGLCALVVAHWGADWISVRSTADNGEQAVLSFDWRVMGWAAGAALVTAVAFSLAPALFAMRLDLIATLRSGGRGMTGGRGHRRFRQALIVGQFALAMVLLTGAALFIRGLDELNHKRAGWQSEKLVTGTVVLPAVGYPDGERITAFHRLVVGRIEALPGVASASVSSFTPFFNWPDLRRFVVEGREPPKPGFEPAAAVNGITSRYLETVGTRLLAGRPFDARDTAAAPHVYIINQAMATGLFGTEDPIGRRLAPVGSSRPEAGEIVGIASDVVSVLPDSRPVSFQLYQPMAQEPQPANEIAIRTAGAAPSTVVDSVRALLAELDSDLPVQKLQPADATVERANYELGVLRDILAAFALLGLGLASLGIYGVITRTMAQRTGEFAIRFAMGASVTDVTRMVLASGLKLALVGSALGLLGAYGVSRLIAAGFPGMHLESPAVLIGTTLLLVAVALLASWLPARRAARVAPIEALRAE